MVYHIKITASGRVFVDVQRTTFGGVFHKKSDSQCIKPVRFHMKSMT
jgi:hypothetical protein